MTPEALAAELRRSGVRHGLADDTTRGVARHRGAAAAGGERYAFAAAHVERRGDVVGAWGIGVEPAHRVLVVLGSPDTASAADATPPC